MAATARPNYLLCVLATLGLSLGILASSSCEPSRDDGVESAPEIHRGEDGTPTRVHDRKPDFLK
jgi:hypothetical protein